MPGSARLARYDHFIDGAPRPPSSGAYFPTDDPYSGRPWAEIARGDERDVDAAVRAATAARANPAWASLSASERGALLYELAEVLAREADALAEVESRDNGKTLAEVRAQIRYLPRYYRYYAGLADKVQSEVIPSDRKGVFAYTRYEPKGVVAAITPWNSPLTLLAWKLAPALAAGCTVVAKPSEHASASTLEFARAFHRAGFPPGVLNVVAGLGAEIGQALVAHPGVAHVAFSGGEETGRRVYELAARGLKTATLELGGKSPNIVFDDADLDRALRGVVAGIFAAAGQTCQAGSRLLVQRTIHDEFVRRLVACAKDARMGDPRDAATQIGPMATRAQLEKTLEYIRVAREEGACCVLGGNARSDLGGGRFVEPTVFTEVSSRMRIAQEEVFGPVLCVMPFEDEDEAIRLANDVRYGLAAGVWTGNLRRAMRLVEQLQAGTVWVNNYRATSVTSPFGGYKRSGLGRESGTEAIRQYLVTKCVWLCPDVEIADPFTRR